MIADEVTIEVFAGKGGNGRVAFNKEKMTLGPAGGNGGKGGDVYLAGTSDLTALNRYLSLKLFNAEDGEPGGKQNKTGKNGEDLVLLVPVGTVVHGLPNDQKIEILSEEKKLVASGGEGGRGNFEFRGPEHTTPTKSEPGEPGEAFKLRLELKFIADLGLIGLPNVGKSSFLNHFTKASSKVANYPFTTLEPSLGVFYKLIIADIPGLIEGASQGKGLGFKFLRHIERTKILFHFISAESTNPKKDYEIIRKELATFNKELATKKEYLILSKSDAVSPKELKEKLAILKKINPTVLPFSILDETQTKALSDLLSELSNKK